MLGQRLRQAALIAVWLAYMVVAGVTLKYALSGGTTLLKIVGWVAFALVLGAVIRWSMRRVDRDHWLED